MKTARYFAFAILLSSSAALAQNSTTLPVENVNFDLWCQEDQHLPAERCDKRLPEDEQAFEAYLAKIQPYEQQYLKEREQQQDVNSGILHKDPIDKPIKPSAPNNDVPGNVPPH